MSADDLSALIASTMTQYTIRAEAKIQEFIRDGMQPGERIVAINRQTSAHCACMGTGYRTRLDGSPHTNGPWTYTISQCPCETLIKVVRLAPAGAV